MAKKKGQEETAQVQSDIEAVNLDTQIKSAKKDTEVQNAVMKSQKVILEKLQPKLSQLRKEISETKLLLIEVKSKMKEYK